MKNLIYYQDVDIDYDALNLLLGFTAYEPKIESMQIEYSFQVIGKHYPATDMEPEEFPEIDILKVVFLVHYSNGRTYRILENSPLGDILEKYKLDWNKLEPELWNVFAEHCEADQL